MLLAVLSSAQILRLFQIKVIVFLLLDDLLRLLQKLIKEVVLPSDIFFGFFLAHFYEHRVELLLFNHVLEELNV